MSDDAPRYSVPGPEAQGVEPWMTDPELYRARALDRARDKIAAIQEGRGLGEPVGRSWSAIVLYILVLAPIAFLCLYFGVDGIVSGLTSSQGTVGLGVFLLLIGAAVASLGWYIWKTSKPVTPKLALEDFYKSLGRGQFNRASDLVVDVDLDDFPRYQPRIERLGRPTGRGFPFSSLDAFREYWSELLRAPEWPYCLVSISKVRVTRIDERLVVADFKARFVINTQLYFLLWLVVGPIAVIVDLATRSVIKENMRKVLVRVGDEWHLLSGDWQGHEEYDTSLLPTAKEEVGPYRGF